MLKPRDLNLRQYFFPMQNVAANPEFDSDKEHGSQFGLETDLSIHFDDEHARYRFTLLLTMRSDDECDGCDNDPYTYEIAAVGIFDYYPSDGQRHSEDEITTIERDVTMMGCTVLLGAVRERFVEMTSRGPWGPCYLDTFNAMDFLSTQKPKASLPKQSTG